MHCSDFRAREESYDSIATISLHPTGYHVRPDVAHTINVRDGVAELGEVDGPPDYLCNLMAPKAGIRRGGVEKKEEVQMVFVDVLRKCKY